MPSIIGVDGPWQPKHHRIARSVPTISLSITYKWCLMKTILGQQFVSGDEISLADFADGQYMVQVRFTQQSKTYRVVKER